ncbi:prolyl 4-hydroxylase subunit alpha-3-like [Branchiostoma floridae]|uniref:procollagen-proline 4-dioxygenase n=1 Tax=Branchiostoma floridae TaxID=7739 RepID=A0A9J7LG16_BRAFL|nr:prolyl 4-hydroxylase subunit alpha-3-like [Branchiostoma floridae]
MLVLVLLQSTLFATVAYASKQHGFSTAVVRLENMLLFESRLIDEIRQYITDTDGASEDLRRYVEDFEHNILRPGFADLAYHARHPVGAYRLVKRLSQTDSRILKHAQLLTGVGVARDGDDVIKISELPTEEDLRMSALALARLQDIYHLDLRSLTRGQLVMLSRQSDGTVVKQKRLSRVEPTFTLEAEDTVYIGDMAYNEEDYLNAVLWYLITLDLTEGKEMADITDDTANDSAPGRVQVLVKLGDALTKLQQHQRALPFYNEALQLEPNNQEIKSKVVESERQVTLQGDVTVKMGKLLQGAIPYQQDYENLCYRSALQNQAPSSRLSCTFVRTSPQLYLSPAKMEVLHETSPEIALYHDVISDQEAAMMRELALKELKRSPVVDKNGKAFLSNFRVSETGWLHDNTTELISKLSRRVSYITGLNTEYPSAESFQVVNYGLGGLYVPHVDYFEEDQVRHMKRPDNRILTFLIYLSEVEAGGATVFPQINLIVPAVKNAALMFRDMKRSGDFEPLSMHAGCPVLIGSKWIANKWILDRGNEFRRPCGLTPEE